jgi:predicted transposase YdaD
MKTDKAMYKIFKAYPEFLFQLARIRKKTAYSMESITLKEFERRTDGIFKPEDPDEPTYVMEFQAQNDINIYHRLTMEMSSFAMTHPNCEVRGILVFLRKRLDPKTRPWHYLSKSKDKLLRIVYLEDYVIQLEKKYPNHPMVMVFKPLFVNDLKVLQNNSKQWYQHIAKSRLSEKTKTNLQDAFVSWLLARFPHLDYKEFLRMIENLPDIEETLTYKQLVAIGEKRGEKRGEKLGEKLGEKRGKKRGEKATLIRQIKHMESLNQNGELDDITFTKLCEPLKKDLKKVTDEIKKMLKAQKSARKK